jgi:heat shock protein HslJ
VRDAAIRLTLAAVATALVAACGSNAPSAAPSSTPGPDRLDGTAWTLVSIDDQSVAAPAPDAVPTLAFAEGMASGNAGCNTFTGSYTVDGPSLTFGPLASTKKACAPAVGDLETAYLAALQGVTAWAVPADAPMGTQLTLTGSGAKLVYRAPAGG